MSTTDAPPFHPAHDEPPDDWAPAPIGLHLLTPPSPLRPARVEALIAFLGARLRDPG